MCIPFNNRILVIDDDESILNIFQSVLNKSLTELQSLLRQPSGNASPKKGETRSFQVDTELQGEIGFKRLKRALINEEPYGLIFVDMRMPPGWDGVQTIKAIREIDQCVQIVIVTAYSDATIEEIVSQVGFTDKLLYLKKPFDDQEILQLAHSLMTRWNLQKRVQYFDDVLENIITNLGTLDLLDFENSLRPFIKNILKTMGAFWQTKDIFLAKIEDEKILFKVGIGRFSNGIINNDNFQKILNNSITKQKVNSFYKVDEYVVLPISMHNYHDVIVGVLNRELIENPDKLLMAMVISSAKLFRQGVQLANLCLEVEKQKKREQELMSVINNLKKNDS